MLHCAAIIPPAADHNPDETFRTNLASIADPSEIEMIDEYLKYIHTSLSMDKTDMTEKMLKVLKDDLATLKFKKAAPKTIEFENGSVNCKDYSAVIDSKFMRKLFDDLKVRSAWWA